VTQERFRRENKYFTAEGTIHWPFSFLEGAHYHHVLDGQEEKDDAMDDQWFDETPVIGERPVEDQIRLLEEIGDFLMESPYGDEPSISRRAGKTKRAWQHTAHVFGHISPTDTSLLQIRDASSIPADESLTGKAIKITLDRLRVANYPGKGVHHILFDFYGRNQLVGGEVEHVHYAMKCRAHEGESAAVIGLPIFIGLNVGGEGVSFRCFTVNLKNEQDEKLLSFLELPVFREGLRLASTTQPALALFSQMAYNLTLGIAKRNRNIPVQEFQMGLDFSAMPARARLSPGSYIAVQVPQTALAKWQWSEWCYNRQSGQITGVSGVQTPMPFNYVMFSVSRHEAA